MAEEKKDKDQEKGKPKKDKEKKPSLIKRTTRYLLDMKGEIKKVVWPSKKQVLNNTGIVIVVVIISGAAIGALDFVLKFGVDLLLRGAA